MSRATRRTPGAPAVTAGAHALLWSISAAAFALGAGTGLYRPAYSALLPSLVADLIARANAVRSITSRVGTVVGATAAGISASLMSATPGTTPIMCTTAVVLAASVVGCMLVADVSTFEHVLAGVDGDHDR